MSARYQVARKFVRKLGFHGPPSPEEETTWLINADQISAFYTGMMKDAENTRWIKLRSRLPRSEQRLVSRIRFLLGLARPDRHRSDIILEVNKNMERSTQGGAFFLNRNGYMGLGPSDARVNDAVFCLGGDVLYILRPDIDRNEYFLVEEAFIHGIMDGELWETRNGGNRLVPLVEDEHFEKVTLF
jgi:hypothetical protein